MASVREYAIRFVRGKGSSGGSLVAGGGNVLLDTPKHALDGLEHTSPADLTRLDASIDTHGLMPKGSGDIADVYHGDLSQGPVVVESQLATAETDPNKVAVPDGAGGVTWSSMIAGAWHPVMAQDPSGAEPDRWWVVVDGSGTAVVAQ